MIDSQIAVRLFACLALPALGLSAIGLGVGCRGGAGVEMPPVMEFPALGQPARVVVLEGGAEPRRPLRYSSTPGDAEKLRIVSDTDATINAGGAFESVNISVSIAANGRAQASTADGSSVAALTITHLGMDMPGMDAAAVATAAELTRGMVMEVTTDARGLSGTVKFEGPLAELVGDGGMGKNMEQLTVPLPEGPVGVGARWRSLAQLRAENRIIVRVATEFVLTGLSGDAMQVSAAFSQVADPQDIEIEGLGEGRLLRLSATGTAKMNVQLNRPLFVSAELAMKMETLVRIHRLGEKVDMETSLKAAVLMERKGPVTAADLRAQGDGAKVEAGQPKADGHGQDEIELEDADTEPRLNAAGEVVDDEGLTSRDHLKRAGEALDKLEGLLDKREEAAEIPQ